MAIPELREKYPETDAPLDSYKHDLQFYTARMKGTMKYEDLKKLGVMRLRILTTVHELNCKNEVKTAKQWLEKLILNLREKDLGWYADFLNPGDCETEPDNNRLWSRFLDHTSHNAVCLSLSTTDLTSKWMQRTEYLLFRWRIAAFDEKAVLAFMKIVNIQYPEVQQDERDRLKDDLCAASMVDPKDFDNTVFYKIPWTEGAKEIIPKRRAVLISGIAYITAAQFKSVVANRFRGHLKSQIRLFQRKYGGNPDPRVYEMVDYFQKIQELLMQQSRPSWTPGKATVEGLDVLAVESFPPCMRNLHETLRKDHHLRYEGRRQYTLFLKAIGIEATEALEFYKKEFTEIMSDDAFDKNYAYFFLHSYGLKGAMKDYQVFDCKQIADTPVGRNEYHGCPFTRDIEDLDRRLCGWNISSTGRGKIAELVKEKKYGKACEAYFEDKHSTCVNCPIVNPTNFYDQSREIINSEENDADNSDKSDKSF